DQVVSGASRRSRWIHAGVTRAQAQIRGRQREREEDDQGDPRREPRPALDGARPAGPSRPGRATLLALREAAGAPVAAGERNPALGEPEAEAATAVELEQQAVHEAVRATHERGDDR